MLNVKIRGFERAALFVVGGAFFLSVLIGILSNNPAGTIIARAFLSAIFFGALLTAGVFILRRYIPDIGSMVSQTREQAETEERQGEYEEKGRVVDYTVEGEPFGDIDGGAGMASSSPPEDVQGQGRTAAAGGSDRASEAKRGAGVEDAADLDAALPSLDSLFENDDEEKGAGVKGALEEKGVVPEGAPLSKPWEEKKSGDVIKIGDIRIPNEPEVLAKAIKKLMKQDQ
jgi:hypothetical protein